MWGSSCWYPWDKRTVCQDAASSSGRVLKMVRTLIICNILLDLTRQPLLKNKHAWRHGTHITPKRQAYHHWLHHRSIVTGNANQMTRSWMSPSFVTHLESHCVFLGVAAVIKGEAATLWALINTFLDDANIHVIVSVFLLPLKYAREEF